MTKFVFKKKKGDLFNLAANLIAKELRLVLNQKRIAVFAVAGGRTIPFIFKILKNKKLDWSRVHFFMVDERLVQVTSKKSNFASLKTNLLNPLLKNKQISRENIHSFQFKSSKLSLAIANYRLELKHLGGKFDLVLLSAGKDGHIASLFPRHNSIKNNSEFYITVNNSPKSPKNRISASKELISSSNSSILLFVNREKQEALIKFKESFIPLVQCPAKIVNQIKNSYVLTNLKV